jgi:glycolate dehydrogenase FAD-binding subunit
VTVLNPDSLDEAAAFLAASAREGTTVGFVGSGSRSELGGRRTYDAAMGTASMTDVIEWLPEDLTVVVGAGMTVGTLEELLSTKKQTSLLPVAEPHRTIGGLVAEGASGYQRLKYGPTRDRVLEVTMATGYGKVVRGGGRLVKNVTGYDLPRLMTGSLGSLGFIGSVCLKLWPLPPARAVVEISDPASAYAALFRPTAVLETESGSVAVVEGSSSDVDAHRRLVDAGDEVELPEAIASPVVCSLRVPPRNVAASMARLKELEIDRLVAQHGVGVIDIGFESLDPDVFRAIRSGIEETGGSAVIVRPGDSLGGLDPWGTRPQTIVIQRRMKDLFDPGRVCNPGVLPGGL